jgi:glucose/arabinose dehydrogenase
MRLPAILAGAAAIPGLALVFWHGSPSGPRDVTTEEQRIHVSTLSDQLAFPWSMAFLPDGGILITERPGRLRIFRDGALQPEPIAGVPAVRAREQGGLLDIALHPDFSHNGLLYLTYLKDVPGGGTTALAQAHFDGTALTGWKDIFVADAANASDGNAGSRVVFGRDGMLYVSVGDRHEKSPAQDLTNHKGKVIRLRDDGSVPKDNPFVGRPGARPEIFAYGLRNPQGLTVHPETGALWEHEHGPRGGDEVNVLSAGANYGWPSITYGINYDGTIVSHDTALPGMEQPRTYWVPSIGPSGMTFYTGDKFPKWRGNLFVGAMAGAHVRRLVVDGLRVVHQEEVFKGPRIRDVRQGPDGLLYLLTDSNQSGSLLRMEPK